MTPETIVAPSALSSANAFTAGPRSSALHDAELEHLAPGTQSVALFSKIAIDHGEGATLVDVDGRRYLDLLAGVGVASLGYAHPKFVRAISEQVAKVHVGSFTSAHRADPRYRRAFQSVKARGARGRASRRCYNHRVSDLALVSGQGRSTGPSTSSEL